MKNGMWVWGFVLDEIPGAMPDMNGKSYCSLETGAEYLGIDNVIYVNSLRDASTLDDKYFKHLANCKNVICSLEQKKYEESARLVSEFSLTHKNISGALIDDFSVEKTKPDELRKVYECLKSKNPDLRLYLVRYTWQDQQELIPYLPYFDAINLWIWISTDYYWRSEYTYDVVKIKKLTGKPVLQGVYMHNYGETWHTSEEPIPMDLLQLQLKTVVDFHRLGQIEGCVILMNGWFCRENHREHMQWMKNYLDWFYGTTTRR